MAQSKPLDTVTYSDHQVITPDHQNLRHAVVPAGPLDGDPIARAEKALSRLSGEFADWMNDDCKKLDAARNDIKANGLNEKNREPLFRAADDVKGNARTLGFAEAAPAANSLCRLLEHSPDVARISIALIEQHVDAIRAIVREHDRKDISMIASVLTDRLRQVTEEFLVQENRHRPGYLESTTGPSLAPGELL
jgi:chemotaxis protein histidine kinase CheA